MAQCTKTKTMEWNSTQSNASAYDLFKHSIYHILVSV